MGKSLDRHKTSSKQISIAKRTEEAAKLRRLGYTLEEIAKELGVVVSTIHKDLSKLIESIPVEEGMVYLRLELDRIDQMFRPAFEEATQGDFDATLVCIKLMERRAKLLGLDGSLKVEVSHDYNAAKNEEVVLKLLALAGAKK